MSIKVKTKANIAIAIALATLAGFGWLSLRESRNLMDADRWVSHTHDVLDVSASLRSHLLDAGVARRIFLQGDSSQVEVFNTAANASLADFNRLNNLTADNKDQQKRLDRMQPLLQARLAGMRKSISVHLEGANDESFQKDIAIQLVNEAAQFAEQAREFDSVEKDLLRERSARADENARATSRIDSILSLLAFGFIIIAAINLNRELSRRTKAEQEIAKQKSLLQSILDTCSDAIVVADSSTRIILRNPAAVQMCGEVIERITEDVPQTLGYYKQDQKTLFQFQELPLWCALQGDQVDNLEMCVRSPRQTNVRWNLASSRPLFNEKGEVLGGVVFYHDITDRKELEDKISEYADELKCSNEELRQAQVALERLASDDELTGLHNRRGFLALAEQSLSLARRAEKPFALVFIDLDGLKKINDTCGHASGDQAISDAASVLRDCFRHCDVLGRLGGDEFAILMVDASEESIRIVRRRVAEKVERFNLEGAHPYPLSLSIGTLMCSYDEKSSVETLLAKADALMYEEKKRKGSCRQERSSPPYIMPNIDAGISSEPFSSNNRAYRTQTFESSQETML
jgi:diguanylate cyclase (GGDEF)-like protein/PAS domain S-box-containing protein